MVAPFTASLRDWQVVETTVYLGLILFLPVLPYYLLNVSSHAVGTLGAAALILVAFSARLPLARLALLIGCVCLALAIHLVVAALSGPAVFVRGMLSMIILAVILAAAASLSPWLFRRSDRVIDGAMHNLRVLMLLIGIWGIVGFQPPSAVEWNKPIFPFTEPSHYALVFAPLLIHACVRANLTWRLSWLLIALILAFTLQNLTMVVVVGLAAAVSLPWYALATSLLLLLVGIGSLDIGYFTDRLDFDARTTGNLSTLVYLQGLDMMQQAIERSAGWGIGFQQLGYVPWRSLATYRMATEFRMELNVQDGGFLLAKMVGEMGWVGILLATGVTTLAIRCALFLRRAATEARDTDGPAVLAACVILGFMVDMYVRGAGYFTGTSMLALTAILAAPMLVKAMRRSSLDNGGSAVRLRRFA